MALLRYELNLLPFCCCKSLCCSIDCLVLPGGLPGPRFFSVGWSAAGLLALTAVGWVAAAVVAATTAAAAVLAAAWAWAAAAEAKAAAGSSPNLMLAEGTVPGRTAVVLVVAAGLLPTAAAGGSWA